MATTSPPWAPDSWRDRVALQQPEWPEPTAAVAVLERLKASPPLVFAGEARDLRESLAQVLEGRAFLLQAGDCVESFNELSTMRIREKLKIILQMSAVLTYGATLPVVKVGRIAGQFTKPRSEPFEHVAGVEGAELSRSHGAQRRGDGRVGAHPGPGGGWSGVQPVGRDAQPAARLTKGGYADLTQVHLWNQEFVTSRPRVAGTSASRTTFERALQFMAACGIDLAQRTAAARGRLLTSHEGLLLDYEEGLTRRDSLTGDWFDCSAHMLWIGERTRQLTARTSSSSRGCTTRSPSSSARRPRPTRWSSSWRAPGNLEPWLPGRLTFVARMGGENVSSRSPPLAAAVVSEQIVLWACDPMHGNTILNRRRYEYAPLRRCAVMTESKRSSAACWAAGTRPGGVHLEFTGMDVTECLGGADDVLESQLSSRYETLCDPRLNARQSLDLAFRLAELMQRAPR